MSLDCLFAQSRRNAWGEHRNHGVSVYVCPAKGYKDAAPLEEFLVFSVGSNQLFI